MGLKTDLRTLYSLAFKRVRGGTHQERLESFYGNQAEGYDDFRKRLLHGREELMRALEIPEGGYLLDMGGGTGSNVEALGDRLPTLGGVTVVDLCPSLVETARKRIADRGWANVTTELADVTTYEPGRRVD